MYPAKFILLPFDGKNDDKIRRLEVPIGSKFLDLKVLPDGIYAYYLVSEMSGLDVIEDQFFFSKGNVNIPELFKFASLLDVVFNPEGNEEITEAVVVVFPIFKKISDTDRTD